MADLSATSANVLAVFAKAAPGDVLTLTGAFGFVALQGRTFDLPLTVDASAATFHAVVIKGVSGVRWVGGIFNTLPKGRDALNVSGGRDLAFDGLSINGDGTAAGVGFRDCQDVALTYSRLSRPRVGVSLLNVARARIFGNLITGWAADAIGLSAVSDSLIERNILTDPIKLDPLIHVDGIQGYFTGPAPNRNVTVSLNTVMGQTQGVFFNTSPGYAPPSGIVIEGNIVTVDAVNGVTLMGDPLGAVKGNRVSTLPGAEWQARVYVSDPATKRSGNAAEAYGSWKAQAD